MSRVSLLLFACFLFVDLSSSNIVRSVAISTKDVPIPRDELDYVLLAPLNAAASIDEAAPKAGAGSSDRVAITNEVQAADVVASSNISPSTNIATPLEVANPDTLVNNKQCAAIGEYCTYHDDCCTFACLGYMKRCVSGSG